MNKDKLIKRVQNLMQKNKNLNLDELEYSIKFDNINVKG